MNGHEVNDSNALIVITIPGYEINDSIRALKEEEEEELRKLYAIKSLGELVAYSDSIGAELNEFQNDWIGLVVQLSGYEIKRSLNPMVNSSKNYLPTSSRLAHPLYALWHFWTILPLRQANRANQPDQSVAY